MLTQYRLKNKLKVLLVESHKAPVVTVQMWVKTGSADEKAGEEGISHFIEHLVFKGTRKFGVGEVAQAVEGAGGELNAYTTFDYTVFHVTMSKDDLEVGLDCIGEMMGAPLFDSAEIDKEREVVLEEIKRSFDDPRRASSRQLFSTLYQTHPYGIPVLGYDKNIKKVSSQVLLDYFHRRYVPSNMTLVVAGDFEKGKIKKQIESHYAGFKPYNLKKIKRLREKVQKSPRVSFLPTEFKEASMNVAFRVPSAEHPDVPAVDILGFILGQGESSRLVRRLLLETTLVNNVSAGALNQLDSGFFTISTQFKAENIFEIHKILLEEISQILNEPIDEGELNRARLNLEADEIFALETVDGLARKVGVFQTLVSDPNHIDVYLKKVQSLTPAEVLKVARKYLTPANMTMTLLLNKEDAKKITKKTFEKMSRDIVEVIKRSKKKKIKMSAIAAKRKKTLPARIKISNFKSKVVKHRLSNGALVILKKNPEIPIFDLKVGFLGGMRVESPDDLGITAVLANTWTSGSMNFSEQKVAATIEGCAGSLSAFGGRNSAGLNLEVLSIHEDKAWEVFSDVLRTPLFPQEAVTRESTLQLEALKTRSDHPSAVVSLLFTEGIFKGHPYGIDAMGTEATLKSLTSSKVFNHWGKMVSAANSVFSVVGDFEEGKILKRIEEMTKVLSPGKKYDQRFPVPPLKSQKYFSKSQKEQTHIIVGYRGLSLTDPDNYAADVLQSILAGQGGRLFINLRDKASLAYSVSPINLKGIETGYFGIYIGCSAEKGKKAIEMIKQELEHICNEVPSHDEVERAKRYLAGRNHIDLQRNGSQASSILFDEIYGIDCEETFRYAEHLKDITGRQVNELAKRLFEAPEVIAAVGQSEPW